MLARREAGSAEVTFKDDGSMLTPVDLETDAILKARLTAARPDYGWLSEETADDPSRLQRRRIFLVDPIDGTRAYVRGRPWFCVSIAVVEDGAPVAGVVLAPALGEEFTATAGGGAFLNGETIAPSDAEALEDAAMVGDAAMFGHPSWPQPWPQMRIEPRNSLAYRMCLVACGAFDAALAPGPKRDWDLGAADLIAREAGAVSCDVKGGRFVFNRPEPTQLGMLAAGPALAALILKRLEPIEWRR
jgi:myo-inositol-1(or 4)-monophosphatase